MNKIALIYWPEGGNVEAIADKLVKKIGPAKIIKMSLLKLEKDALIGCSYWIVGGSTVGSHVWEDANDSNKWNAFFKQLKELDMSQKTVAFYGLGDQVLYPNHFVDGLGLLYEEFAKHETRIVGQCPVEGYKFLESDGVIDGKFAGLALDEDNEDEKSDARIEGWLKIIGPDFGI